MQKKAAQLADWLQHVRIQSRHLSLDLPYKPNHPTHLHTQLTALSHLRLHDARTEKWASLDLSSWPLTREAMKMLLGLPCVVRTLDLRTCTWPLKHTEYKSLAQYVPLGFTEWAMGREVPEARVKSVCKGINERRAGLGLAPVRVCVDDRRGVGGEEKVGECVIVCDGWWRTRST